eukprot:12922188-Prorocentrum_lima.AAC.1
MGKGVDLDENAGLVSLEEMIQRNKTWVRHADAVWVFSLGSDCGNLSEFEWPAQWHIICGSLASMVT